MNRAHDHSHHEIPASNRAFKLGVILNLGFVIVEVVFGLLADSLALLTDAGHNLSDVLALLLAWGAVWLAGRKPTPRHTYGYSRGTILASLLSALMLLVAVGIIVWEAVHRLSNPSPVAEITMMWVAGLGVVINTGTALLFMRGSEHDLNIRGAFLHMAADAIVSLGVVMAGALILWTGKLWIDPVISLVIAGVLGDKNKLRELRDSKKTTRINEKKAIVSRNALAIATVSFSPAFIDSARKKGISLNELQAKAFKAINFALNPKSEWPAIVDGMPLRGCNGFRFVIKGDDLEPVVGAASIIAKSLREESENKKKRTTWKNS